MINIGYDLLAGAAEKKVSFFKRDKGAYFISSMLAGVYVGICMVTIQVMAGMFDNFVAPYVKEMADEAHRLGARIMFHSCGDVTAYIPSIIACGVDILNPIQPVGNMTTAALQRYKGKIAFHGGIDVQKLLPEGPPEAIKREIRRYAAELGPGYIACPAHLFQPDTPPEHIAAFYEARCAFS